MCLCQAVCLDARANSRHSKSKVHLHRGDPVIVICCAAVATAAGTKRPIQRGKEAAAYTRYFIQMNK